MKLMIVTLFFSTLAMGQSAPVESATFEQLTELKGKLEIRIQTLNSVGVLENGLLPGKVEDKKTAIRKYLSKVEVSLTGAWKEGRLNTPECRDFLEVQDEVRTDIAKRLVEFHERNFQDSDRFFQSRFEILDYHMAKINDYALDDAEGGVGEIVNGKKTCVMQERQAWKVSLQNEQASYNHLLLVLFGQRGLINVYQVSETIINENLKNALNEEHFGIPAWIATAVIPFGWEALAVKVSALASASVKTAFLVRFFPAFALNTYLGGELGRSFHPGVILSDSDYRSTLLQAKDFTELRLDSPTVYATESVFIEEQIAKSLRQSAEYVVKARAQWGSIEEAKRVNMLNLSAVEKTLEVKAAAAQ